VVVEFAFIYKNNSQILTLTNHGALAKL
jgi:hypothetical protein